MDFKKFAQANISKIFTVLAICLMSLTMVWAFNPFEWNENPENATQEGRLFIINISQEWNPIKATEQESELTFWTLNAKDKKTELGWIVPNGCGGWDDRYIYDENNTIVLDGNGYEVKALKCESSKCDRQDCYHISLTNEDAININEFIKLGENSFISEYQDINTLNYNLDWAEVNISLYKNISNNWNNTVNSIWIHYNNDSYKFGANDSENEGFESYKYQIKSDTQLIKDNLIIYVKNINPNINGTYDIHEFNFNDICNRSFETNCSFNLYKEWNNNLTKQMYNFEIPIYDYYAEVTFISDSYIDPEITIDEKEKVPDYMECLFKTFNNSGGTTAEEIERGNYKRGDIVLCKPLKTEIINNISVRKEIWGTSERDTNKFGIIIMESNIYNSSWTESLYNESMGEENRTVLKRRHFTLNIQDFLNSTEITILNSENEELINNLLIDKYIYNIENKVQVKI